MEIKEKNPDIASPRRERIQLLLREVFQGNKAAFARKINVDPSTLNKVLSGQTQSVSTKIIEGIMANIEDNQGNRISRDWLEDGEGQPFTPSTDQSPDLEETGRTTYLKVVGPGGQVMAQIDLVFLGTTKPHQISLDIETGIE